MAKNPIPIFSRERTDGIEQAIANNHSLAYISPVILAPTDLQKTLVTAEALAEARLALGEKADFDLYPIYTILVTTGCNKNDDIFTAPEAWAARLTPEDKPFNLSHIPSKIIGHITGCVVVDDNLAIIADNSTVDELPPKFHILTSAVVYKHINSRDKDLQVEAAELIEGIQKGEWFVSMEALFSNFDYGLTSAAGEQQIVTRCEGTAFLTKHLRVYGGTGEYNGCKVGRVLRNITFSGKGLVKNPANPESVIFNDSQKFVGVLASFKVEEHVTNASSGDNNMSAELDQIKTLQEQLASANRKIEELGEKQVQATVASKDAEIAKAQSTVAEQAKKIEELTASYNAAVADKATAEKAKADSDAKLTEANTQLTEANKQLDTIKAEAQKTNRISTLVSAGVEKAAAEEIVTKFAAASDETFAEIVKMQTELVAAKKAPPKEDDKGGKGGEGDCGKAKADETADPTGEAAAAGADLNNATTDQDAALAAADENKNGEVISALASYFQQTLVPGRSDK